MTEFIVALIASLVFTAAIAYVVWIRIRVLRLKTDLMNILLALRHEAMILGCPSDPAYRTFCRAIMGMEENADLLSLSAIRYAKDHIQVENQLGSENPDMQKVLDTFSAKVSSRVANYLIRETLSGRLYVFRNGYRRKMEEKQKVKCDVLLTFEPIGSMMCHCST